MVGNGETDFLGVVSGPLYVALQLCSSTSEFWWRNGGRNGLKSKGFFLRKCDEKVGGETGGFFAFCY